MTDAFEDLLAANRAYAETFALSGFDGVAHAGVAVVTCMDSRIDPLGMLGLTPGDAKIFRNPGGRVTPAALEALVLGVHLLNVQRILVVPHTRCAMASSTLDDLRRRVGESAGQDASWQTFGVVEDQEAAIGRTKLDNIEIKDKATNSHVALNVIEDADGAELKILRDNMPFGSIKDGEFGTYYIAYAATPDVPELMLRRMFLGEPFGNYDRILDFSTAVTGSLFFVPTAAFLDDLPA